MTHYSYASSSVRASNNAAAIGGPIAGIVVLVILVLLWYYLYYKPRKARLRNATPAAKTGGGQPMRSTNTGGQFMGANPNMQTYPDGGNNVQGGMTGNSYTNSIQSGGVASINQETAAMDNSMWQPVDNAASDPIV